MNYSNKKPNNVIRLNNVEYLIPESLKVGQSFFLPCLEPKAAFFEVSNQYFSYEYKLVWVERIELGVLGIRIWREA